MSNEYPSSEEEQRIGLEEEQRVGLLSTNMEARADHQMSKRYHLLHSVTTGVGIILVVLTGFWIYHFRGGLGWTSNPKLQFNWHPLMMILGMIFTMGQSILIYRSLRTKPKLHLKYLHAGLHGTTIICAIVALIAVFDFHNLSVPPKPNLYTLHSWLGLITEIVFVLQFVIGFVTFLYPGLSKELRAKLLPAHTFYGTIVFTLAVITAMMGLAEKAIFELKTQYSLYSSEGILINILGAILTFFGVLVLYLLFEQSYKRVPLPNEEVALTDAVE